MKSEKQGKHEIFCAIVNKVKVKEEKNKKNIEKEKQKWEKLTKNSKKDSEAVKI